MKRILSSILTIICFIGIGGGISACSATYRVTAEEYEKAFSDEAMSNLTICIRGPYWERDQKQQYYYRNGDTFALCLYKDEMQYYGQYYTEKDGEEAYYLYGSEYLKDFTKEFAFWRKSEIPLPENSYLHKAEFVRLYERDFHLLEYDRTTRAYQFEFTAQGYTYLYSYYFTNKQLTKFEISTPRDEAYQLTWEFYNYNTTTIPVQVE